MKKIKALIGGAISGLALAASTAVPAQAGENLGHLNNQAGSRVELDCSYNGVTFHRDHYMYDRSHGGVYSSSGFSGCSDLDAFKLDYDRRCLRVTSAVNPDLVGYYKADPGHAFKIPGLTTVQAYREGTCDGAWRWFGNYFKRISG